jgi:ribosomal protein S18 acetylase RimI-like enzyme
MKIRPAVNDDCAALARIQVDSYRSAYTGLVPDGYLARFACEEQEQDWRDLLSAHEPPLLLVAESESGQIAGYALGRAGRADIEPYDSELVALHVRPWAQRLGVGRQLVAALVQHLLRQGCGSLMLWMLAGNRARSFYEGLGGCIIGEQTMDWGEGWVTTEVAYGWPCLERLARLAAARLSRNVVKGGSHAGQHAD